MNRLLAAGLALMLMGQAAPPMRITDLGWMSGHWETRAANNVVTEETWSAPRGGLMLGHSRTIEGERTREFEFLRIIADEDGVLSYIAPPPGCAI